MSTQGNGSGVSVSYRRFAAAALVAIVGIAATLGFFYATYARAKHRIRKEFDSLATDRFHAVENMIAATTTLLSFTDDVFQVGPRADSPEFANYVRSLKALLERDLAGHLELNGLTWVPRVTPADRNAYETAGKAVLSPQFQLHEPAGSADNHKDRQPADSYPNYLCLGKTALSDRVGEDLSLDPEMWNLMEKARDTGTMVAGNPMKLSDTVHHLGYRIFVPLYAGNEPGDVASRRANNIGFLCVDLAVGELIDLAFEELLPVGIMFSWTDTTNENSVDVCQHVSRLEESSNCETQNCASDYLESNLATEFMGRKVLLRCNATAVFWDGRTIWEPWVLLIGGLALTIMGTLQQLSQAVRAQTIDRVVSTRLAAIQREAQERR